MDYLATLLMREGRRQKKELILATGGKKCGETVKGKEDRMQSQCFGGKEDDDDEEEEEEEKEASKRILRFPGITPDSCTSAVQVGGKDSESKKKKIQEVGSALTDTGYPAVMSHAGPDR